MALSYEQSKQQLLQTTAPASVMSLSNDAPEEEKYELDTSGKHRWCDEYNDTDYSEIDSSKNIIVCPYTI